MADVDMELDIAHPTGLDGHVDDDLIDYDDDDVVFSGTTWTTQNAETNIDHDLLDADENMQMHGEQETSRPSTQTLADKPLSQADEEILVEIEEAADNDTVMSPSHEAEISAGENGTIIHAHEDAHDAPEAPQTRPADDEASGSAATTEKQSVVAQAEIDEIDYDDDDDDGGVGIVAEPSAAGQNSSLPANEGAVLPSQTNKAVEKDDERAEPIDLVEHNHASAGSAINEEVPEIDWEDHDGQENSVNDKNPTVVQNVSEPTESSNQNHEAEESGQVAVVHESNHESAEWDEAAHGGNGGHESTADLGEDAQHEHKQYDEHDQHKDELHEYEQHDYGQNEHEQADAQEQYDHAEHGDEQPNAHDASAEAEQSHYADADDQSSTHHDKNAFPTVTVVYREEEYPLASEHPDAFLSDPAAQEFTMKDLLAHLRDALGEDIAPTDELVFKVDELGLEFSETSPEHLLINTTLREVVTVFDVLVSNQNPEDTRNLYAYLYAKPNTMDRLQFLMQSAANGIGLDAVVYSYQPLTAHGSSTNHTVDGLECHEEEEFAGEGYDEQRSDYATNGNHGDEAGYEEGHDFENQADGHNQSGVGQAVESDDKIDFTLGFENPSVEGSRTQPSNSADFLETTPEADDELQFDLDQPTAATPAAKDASKNDEVLSEIDWRDDASALEDDALEEATATPSSATKRSRPDDVPDLDSQQDTKRPRI